MIITFGSITICNGATRTLDKSCGPRDLRINGAPSLQPKLAIGAVGAQSLDRGNVATTVSFAVTRTLATPEAAASWIVSHAIALTNVADLTLSGLGKLTACGLADFELVQRGASVEASYAFTGGKMEVP